MKVLFLVLAGMMTAAVASSRAGDGPRGEYTEVHSCEVYTGGCTASAQATLGGRTVLRVWNFDQEKGDLAGLSVAALEVADANLAMKGTTPTAAIAYLPEQSTETQRSSLLNWLQKNDVKVTDSRVRPIVYSREGSVISFSAGKEIGFSTRGIEDCDAGSCGEQLWYEPRGGTDSYTVLVNERSHVDEPGLQLSWKDNSAKSVFFGKFGNDNHAVFTQAELPK